MVDRSTLQRWRIVYAWGGHPLRRWRWLGIGRKALRQPIKPQTNEKEQHQSVIAKSNPYLVSCSRLQEKISATNGPNLLPGSKLAWRGGVEAVRRGAIEVQPMCRGRGDRSRALCALCIAIGLQGDFSRTLCAAVFMTCSQPDSDVCEPSSLLLPLS